MAVCYTTPLWRKLAYHIEGIDMDDETRAPRTDQEVIDSIKEALKVNTLIDAERAVHELLSKRTLIATDASGQLYIAQMTAGSMARLIAALEDIMNNTVVGR